VFVPGGVSLHILFIQHVHYNERWGDCSLHCSCGGFCILYSILFYDFNRGGFTYHIHRAMLVNINSPPNTTLLVGKGRDLGAEGKGEVEEG
jgi:hypothetical protein